LHKFAPLLNFAMIAKSQKRRRKFLSLAYVHLAAD
jgi:hypothetical protein